MISYVAHGRLNIAVDDNIIVIEAMGPWNDEFIPQLHQQLIAAVQHVDINNYGVLLSPQGEAISSPISMDRHSEFVKKGRAKAVALNLSDCSSKSITTNIFSKVYKRAGLNHQFFETKQPALDWLQSQLS